MTQIKTVILILAGILLSLPSAAQKERSEVRKGVRQLEENAFSEAELHFRRAEELKPGSLEASNNIGHALYGQEKFEESQEQFSSLLDQVEDQDQRADLWYNQGNSLVSSATGGPMADQEMLKKAIEAYKETLRLRPSDQDARYNLAYTRRLLQEQQNQDQNQDQESEQEKQDQDQDQESEQDEQDQDQDQESEQDEQEQDQEQDQESQEDEQNEQQEGEDQQEQQAEMQMSKEDAERMLKAIAEQDKEVKAKLDKEKAAKAKVKSDKDW